MLIKSFYLCDIYKQNCMEISHWYHFGSLNIWNGSEIPEENVKWYCSGCKIVNQDPLNGTHLVAVRGLIHEEVLTRVHKREELNRVSQLKSSDQQIFSTMSRPESTLIRQD